MNILGMKNVFQLYLFLTLYVGYFFYIFNRRSFGFLIPTISKKNGLNHDAVGTILSSLAIAYGMGKFLSGMLVDHFSPRIMFAVGLFGTGITNLLFSISNPSWFAYIWFLNGLFQGPGWPACAKILRRWYSPKIFGTLWSALSTSMNVPASFGPLMCATYITMNGGYWRPVMLICGTLSCGYALATLLVVKDKPEDIGFSLETLSDDQKKASVNGQINTSKDKHASSPTSVTGACVAIFSNFYAYLVSFGFMVSYLVKGILSDWIALYLIQDKGADTHATGMFIAWMEGGGIVGSIFTGYVSDKLVENMGTKSKGHPRHYIYITSSFVISISLAVLQSIEDVKKEFSLVFALAFVIGFCVYGIMNLSGVLIIENTAEDISGTAHACVALFGNVGLILSGLPFSKLLGFVGWNKAIQVCEIMLLLLGVVFIVSQWFTCRIRYKEKKA